MNKKLLFGLATAVALTFGAGAAFAQTVLRFGHTDRPLGTRHATAEYFAKKVKEYTEGRYVVEIFHSGQLGPDPKVLEQLRVGGVDFTNIGTIGYAALEPEISLTALPFLFASYEEGQKYYDNSKWLAERFARLTQKNLRVIATWEAGFRDFATTFPLNSPADAKGKPVRVFANDMLRWFTEDLGFKPVVLPVTDTYLAIQQGTVTGQDNPVAQLYSMKIYEVAKYITQTRHMYSPLPTVVSEITWKRLSEQDQRAVMRAAGEAAIFSRKAVAEAEAVEIADMQAKGTTIVRPDLAPFRAAVEGTYAKARKQYGDQVDVVLEEVKALRRAN